MASGLSDPFHPGAVALARALPPGAVVDFSVGCHTGPFFLSQEPPSLAFLARHLAPIPELSDQGRSRGGGVTQWRPARDKLHRKAP